MTATKLEKKAKLNHFLSFEIRCLTYAYGPFMTLNDTMKRKDPIAHSSPNFLGFKLNTGRSMKHMKKHRKELRNMTKNKEYLSNMERLVYHSGSVLWVVSWLYIGRPAHIFDMYDEPAAASACGGGLCAVFCCCHLLYESLRLDCSIRM